MKQKRKSPFFITFFDGMVIAGVLIFIGTLAFFIYGKQGGRLQLYIRSADKEQFVSLEKEQTISLRGPAGETVIHVHDGMAEVVSSDCPEKICVRSGTIKEENNWIACLPNHVLIRIKGTTNDGIDAESY
ncbi:MAG: NusG domain II-containing protein [Spirochaetales bacterium]|nr:NusG domain II-containing protein [Spirochaetales bacterium]